jgi:hypothetical protein
MRIAPGIYRDSAGLSGVVKVRNVQREKRFPHGTSLKVIRRWQHDQRAKLQRQTHALIRGTLAADITRYLRQIQHLASWRERRSELRAWIALHGPLPRSRPTAEHRHSGWSGWGQT